MRYTLSFQVVDPFHSIWVSVFDDVGRNLLKCTADELSSKLNEDQDSFDEIFNPIRLIPYEFRIRVRKTPSTFADSPEPRLNYTVVSVGPVDFAKESQVLLDEIARYGFDV